MDRIITEMRHDLTWKAIYCDLFPHTGCTDSDGNPCPWLNDDCDGRGDEDDE